MKPTRVSKEKVLFQNRFLKLHSVVADFDTFQKEYFVTTYGRRVGVLVLKDDSVLLVRQYRLLIDRLSWEIPGGKVEDNETFEEAAVKECLEETGVRCNTLNPLFQYYPGTECVNNPTYLFYSKDFEKVGEIKDQTEIHSAEWMPFSECLDMIIQQKILDGLTVIALFSYAVLHKTPGR